MEPHYLNIQNLKVTIFQAYLFWENIEKNLQNIGLRLQGGVREKTDLIVLPEMFSTAFSMNTTLAEPMNLTTFKWMKQQAAQTKAVILGSVMIREGEKVFNRMIWMQPDGQFQTYDKRHLFRMGNEHAHYEGGNKRLITTLKGWKICPLICYDLRFPVWSRNVAQEYDVLIYVANWPAARAYPWKSLLVARAIENQSYVVGVNRVGKDGNDYAFSGDSAVLNFKGEYLFEKSNEEAMVTITLSKEDLNTFRTQFPAYLDADKFEIFE